MSVLVLELDDAEVDALEKHLEEHLKGKDLGLFAESDTINLRSIQTKVRRGGIRRVQRV